MQIIRDIRLYKSSVENIDGNSMPSEFMTKKNNIVTQRIVWKLRESGFVLGDFHHLYINFTTCILPETYQFAKRSINREFKWYRYVDYGITEKDFNRLEKFNEEYFAEKIKVVLCGMFFKSDNEHEKIESCIAAALHEKENMCVRFKEKKSAKLTAVIYMRITDEGYFSPLLIVTENISGREVLREDLPLTNNLYQFGNIKLNSKRLQIDPRSNVYSAALNLKSIEFELK